MVGQLLLWGLGILRGEEAVSVVKQLFLGASAVAVVLQLFPWWRSCFYSESAVSLVIQLFLW